MTFSDTAKKKIMGIDNFFLQWRQIAKQSPSLLTVLSNSIQTDDADFSFIVSLMQITRCSRMEKAFKGQELEPPLVFEVNGEPAIIINGLPKTIPCSKEPESYETTCDIQQADDPVLGEWLEGRKVQKLFAGQYYVGEVVKYDPEVNWYRVVYDDGDSEDFEWHELEQVLLPLDINIPLKLLTFQRIMHDKVFVEAMPIPKSSHPKTVMEKLPELDQFTLTSGPLHEVPVHVDLSSGFTILTSLGSEKSFQEALQWQEIVQSESANTTPISLCNPEENSTLNGKSNAESTTNITELFKKTTEIKGEGSLQANMIEDTARLEALKRQRRILKQTMETTRAEKQKRIHFSPRQCNQN